MKRGVEFWVLWNEDSFKVHSKHRTHRAAEREARRLEREFGRVPPAAVIKVSLAARLPVQGRP